MMIIIIEFIEKQNQNLKMRIVEGPGNNNERESLTSKEKLHIYE